MVHLGTARLAVVIVTIGMAAMAGTPLAFAQQQPSCGEQAYGYIGCTPMDTARLYGGVVVAGVVALAIGCGAAGVRYHTIP